MYTKLFDVQIKNISEVYVLQKVQVHVKHFVDIRKYQAHVKKGGADGRER